ncbi:MAG: AtpZ/AtpI family protein [Crocinitomicaceae bacterium]|nr:AtpZ/AtpI family protein [Crocinitomicaceae bacterium]
MSKKNTLNKFIKFSSIGIQMGATIAFFSWLGTYLDEKQKMETPWWTVGLSLFGVITSLVLVIREAMKMNK